jgi:cell shape-determining protein MreC
VKARLHLPSGNGIFAILMIGAAILMLLPSRWTAPLRTVRQVLVPFQDGLYSLTSGSPRPPGSRNDRPTVPAEQYEKVVRELEAMRNEAVSLQLMLHEIEAEQGTVEMYLKKFFDRSAVRQGKLVPARVIACDPLSWRDAALLGTGRRSGVQMQAWVASRSFLDTGSKDGVEEGMVVMAREYLIGQIKEVTPFSSAVVLLSDVESRAEAWIGRIEGTTFRVVAVPEQLRGGARWAEPGHEKIFFLHGRGRGEMVVRGVIEDYIKLQAIAVGDLVVSPGSGHSLPVAMVIGRIEAIEDDPSQRQLRQLVVRCPIDTSALRWVYVLDVSSTGR